MPGDPAVTFFKSLRSVVRMRERFYVGVKISVKTVFGGKTDERLQILIFLSLGLVDVVEKNENGRHPGVGHRI